MAIQRIPGNMVLSPLWTLLEWQLVCYETPA
jgi:hypothetical protein